MRKVTETEDLIEITEEQILQDKIFEIYHKFKKYTEMPIKPDKLDLFCARVLKRASVLFVEESMKKIDAASSSITVLKSYLQAIEGYDFSAFGAAFDAARRQFDELQTQCSTLKQKFGQIESDEFAAKSCIVYVCSELEKATKAKSEFGEKLAWAVSADTVIDCYNDADSWYNKLLDIIDLFEKTPNIIDDGLINVCEVLIDYIKDFRATIKEEVNANFKNSAQRLFFVANDAAEKYQSIVDVAGIVIHIGNQLITVSEKVSQLSSCIGLYVSANDASELTDLKKARQKYEDKVIEISESFMNNFKQTDISFQSSDEIMKIARTLKNDKATLDELYAVIAKKLPNCCKIMSEGITSDSEKIKTAFKRVKPAVPAYISGFKDIYYPDVLRYRKVRMQPVRTLESKATATVALSTLLALCNVENVQHLSDKGVKKIFSIAALKAFGIVSKDTEAVLVVDDGYPVSTLDIKWDTCFADEDQERLFFTENAMKQICFSIKA